MNTTLVFHRDWSFFFSTFHAHIHNPHAIHSCYMPKVMYIPRHNTISDERRSQIYHVFQIYHMNKMWHKQQKYEFVTIERQLQTKSFLIFFFHFTLTLKKNISTSVLYIVWFWYHSVRREIKSFSFILSFWKSNWMTKAVALWICAIPKKFLHRLTIQIDVQQTRVRMK